MSFMNTMPAIYGGKVTPVAPTFDFTPWRFATNVQDVNTVWTNPSNVLDNDDDEAGIILGSSATSGALRLWGWNFAPDIPAGCMAIAFEFRIRWRSSATNSTARCSLFKNTATQAFMDNLAPNTPASANTLRTDDLTQGNFISTLLFSGYTVADLADGDVRVNFSVSTTSAATVNVAYVQMRVKYAVPGFGLKLSSTPRNFPDVGATTGSGTAWSNPNNIISDNGSAATSNPSTGAAAQTLRATDFDFAIPVDAYVFAAIIDIQQQNSGASETNDWSYCLNTGFGVLGFTPTDFGIWNGTSFFDFNPAAIGTVAHQCFQEYICPAAGPFQCSVGSYDTAIFDGSNVTASMVNGVNLGVDYKPTKSKLNNLGEAFEVDFVTLAILYVESL